MLAYYSRWLGIRRRGNSLGYLVLLVEVQVSRMLRLSGLSSAMKTVLVLMGLFKAV